MGGLPYLTPLRITWGSHSAIAYKRDIGLGGGPIDGLPRVIDLWWELAGRLGIPYEDGLWSGPVQIERPPDAGAGNLLEQTADGAPALIAPSTGAEDAAACSPAPLEGVPLTSGDRAQLLPNGLAAAPADAPAAVKRDHRRRQPDRRQAVPVRWRPRAAAVRDRAGVRLLEQRRAPALRRRAAAGRLRRAVGHARVVRASGPGRWVTMYASADHVFMYVAGLRWDTHNAAGPDDGSTGIGWHPLVRSDAGFVARHPVGL